MRITETVGLRPASSAESGSASAETAEVRVASVPAGHVYVRHLCALDAAVRVRRLPDPPPVIETTEIGQWWPPAMLDPEWVARCHSTFDVFHVQFGFDAQEPAQLRRLVAALERFGKPLVYTAHDLRNPHHGTPDVHDAHLDVLIPSATAVITLTSGAAQVIARRWHRDATVIPHPHVIPLDRFGARAARDGHGFVVGVHAKSGRASMNTQAVIAELRPLTDELAGLRIVVNVHRDVYDSASRRHDAVLRRFLDDATAEGWIDLTVHEFYSDDELWSYLENLDASVLPYRFGTHSGWLEACYDLGTPVVAPSCGFFAQQRPCAIYQHDEDGLDGESLRGAVRRVYRDRPHWQASRTMREEQRAHIADAHLRLYRSVLS